MKILKGEARRKLRDGIAFKRACFEREYAGRQIVPMDREFVVGCIPEEYRVGGTDYNRRQITICISDAFVKECQHKVPYMHRLMDEFPEE